MGAWRALEETGLTPSHIVATSMGAVVGAALAAGLTWRAVASAAQTVRRQDVASVDPLSLVLGMFATSLLNGDALKHTIDRLIPARWFSDLKIPLTVTATDLDTGELALFGAGGRTEVPLHDALYASCALPLYLPPITIATRRYGEGGLRAVLPLGVARTIPADLYVAVHVGPGFDEQPPPDTAPSPLIPPLIRLYGEVERIMMAAQAEREVAEWPADGPKLVLVRPVKEREATFRIEDGARYIDVGYEATKQALG
ncbi:MAG: patatin-like phospholipase family protein [Gemmatimonadetes bacterium]|nr:patatin-like phospholipase family protein [Gemmatimonadota bacterium]